MTLEDLKLKRPDVSDVQWTYALALAHYQMVSQKFSDRTSDLSGVDGNPYIEGTTAYRIHAELRVDQAFALLVRAEDLLIAWADRQFRQTLGSQRYRQIRPAFENATKMGIKSRLVEICFAYRAPKEAA